MKRHSVVRQFLIVLVAVGAVTSMNAQSSSKMPTLTRASVEKNPVQEGQTANITAIVASIGPGEAAPSGEVEFIDGSTSLGTVAVQKSEDGLTATLSISTLAVGPHPITARYVGDATFAGSVAEPAMQFIVAKP